jgi:hypothetical protein
MSYRVAFLGDLTFSGVADLWLGAEAAGAAYDDWPAVLAARQGDGAPIVRDVLDDLPRTLLVLDRGEARVKLRVLLDEDAYLQQRRALAAAFREAARHGGEGELLILGWRDYPGQLAIRVRAHPSGVSTCEELDAEAEKGVLQGAAFKELAGIVESSAKPPQTR